MKYCSNCGKEIFDDAAMCPICGATQEITEIKPPKDKMNIFWFIISFLWWWLGLILYFTFRKSDPQKAKVCLSGVKCVFTFAIIVGLVMLLISIIGSLISGF